MEWQYYKSIDFRIIYKFSAAPIKIPRVFLGDLNGLYKLDRWINFESHERPWGRFPRLSHSQIPSAQNLHETINVVFSRFVLGWLVMQQQLTNTRGKSQTETFISFNYQRT